jgi:hypothetical protein
MRWELFWALLLVKREVREGEANDCIYNYMYTTRIMGLQHCPTGVSLEAMPNRSRSQEPILSPFSLHTMNTVRVRSLEDERKAMRSFRSALSIRCSMLKH